MQDHLDYPDYPSLDARARQQRSAVLGAIISSGLGATWAAIGQVGGSRANGATGSLTMKLAWLLLALGMSLLAVQSLSGNVAGEAKPPSYALTGETLSTLHAAIPAEPEAQEPVETF